MGSHDVWIHRSKSPCQRSSGLEDPSPCVTGMTVTRGDNTAFITWHHSEESQTNHHAALATLKKWFYFAKKLQFSRRSPLSCSFAWSGEVWTRLLLCSDHPHVHSLTIKCSLYSTLPRFKGQTDVDIFRTLEDSESRCCIILRRIFVIIISGAYINAMPEHGHRRC